MIEALNFLGFVGKDFDLGAALLQRRCGFKQLHLLYAISCQHDYPAAVKSTSHITSPLSLTRIHSHEQSRANELSSRRKCRRSRTGLALGL